VNKWQKAFEAAGFKNAIMAVDAPNDSTFDPEDVRYSTIRWITSNEPSFGAIGPSRVDPRTGEIFDSDILFEASMFQNYANAYRRFAGPEAIAQTLLPSSRLGALPANLKLDKLCLMGDALSEAGTLQHMDLLMSGALEPGSPVPDEYLKNAVEWAVMHEVGHALGLRHNFRSSTSTPVDHLHDAAWTEANGLYSSVMEYPSPNVDGSGPTHHGDWWTTTPGTYDLWAIRYGYAPTGAGSPDDDYKVVRKIADEAAKSSRIGAAAPGTPAISVSPDSTAAPSRTDNLATAPADFDTREPPAPHAAEDLRERAGAGGLLARLAGAATLWPARGAFPRDQRRTVRR
jgi:hypothetical protein